jgi:hypothetical protein
MMTKLADSHRKLQDIREKIEAKKLEILSSRQRIEPTCSLIRQTDSLPVFFDLHLVYAITRDLEGIIYLDDGELVEKYVDTRTLHFIKAMAAQTYPELIELQPKRTENSIDCPDCMEGGRVSRFKEASFAAVCNCGGLGWLPD